MSVGATIRRLRKARGLTILEVATIIGSDVGNLSRLERGEQGYSQAILEKIAGALEVRVADLFASEENVENLAIRGAVPLISWIRAGQWADVADPYAVGDAEDWKSCPVRHGDRTFALKVKGSSMSNPGGRPSFEEGDIIFVDPDREPTHKSLVIVRLDDQNEATFKRLIIDGDSKFLEALNPSWPDRIIKVNGNATFCGVVIARMESYI